jgi:hypothetical protein
LVRAAGAALSPLIKNEVYGFPLKQFGRLRNPLAANLLCFPENLLLLKG